MDHSTLIALLIVAVVVLSSIGIGIAVSFSRRRKQKAVCPRCGRAWVEGFQRCPFCHYVRTAAIPPVMNPLQAGVPHLTWREGAPAGGLEVALEKGRLTIGRGNEADVRIESLLVSRQHANIVQEGTEWVLCDNDSTNGTYVNDNRVARWALHQGDRIRVGPAVLVFHQAGGPTGEPTVIPSPPPPIVDVPSPAQMVQRLGDFTLLRRLGGGGMAAVYLAETPQQQQVAIKVFMQTDPYLVRKFQQEGALKLKHPHIVQVYNLGEVDHTMYLVMEYVEGIDLRMLLHQHQPLPLDMVVPLVGQTCEALEYAHSHGVIHRDIKPENIRLSPTQGVKLLDFGIAKMTSAVTVTSDGMLIGTPYYMSYEQAKGEPVAPASDVYSLGVVIYEMLTARVPFEGKQLDVIHKHLTLAPPPLRQWNPSVPPEIEEAVLKCLSKDLGRRFSSARDLANALHYRADMPLPALPPISQVEAPGPGSSYVPPQSGVNSAAGIVARFRMIQGGSKSLLIPAGEYLTRRDLSPEDLTISRKHAQVLYQDGRLILQDQSLHGTQVDNYHLHAGQSVPLQVGARIQIGMCVLQYEGYEPGGRAPVAAPTRGITR